MFRQQTEYERSLLLYKFLTENISFKHKKDLGDIYEIESNGKDLKFFDFVKMRKTGIFYKCKEIVLLNVTNYSYINFEGISKFTMTSGLEYLFFQLLFGFEVKSYDEELKDSARTILARKEKYSHGVVTPLETHVEWEVRASHIWRTVNDMGKGLINDYLFFFVSNDPHMVRPYNIDGYLYFLARCLSDMEKFGSRRWYGDRYKRYLEFFFGNDAIDINEKYHEYTEIADSIGVHFNVEDIACPYNSLEEIQSNIKSRIYIFYEVAKYFFKNGRQFSEKDINDINKRSYNIRCIYSALGGKYCLQKGEEKDMIAYFTALRCTLGDLPMLLNATDVNELASQVINKRFENSR